MTDRPKPKNSIAKHRNDGRSNGKASKKDTGSHTRSTRLSELEKVLLGGGGYRRLNGVGSDPRTQPSPKRKAA